jgi:hypothetical protein
MLRAFHPAILVGADAPKTEKKHEDFSTFIGISARLLNT